MIAAPALAYIHFFGPGVTTSPASEEILGGKGRSLAQMTQANLPVPPGFTLSTECCRNYHETRKWPDGLEAQLREAMHWLEQTTDMKFGSGPKPLLVAVRSGAAVSMPGMMDTVLNVGLRRELETLCPSPGHEVFWGLFRDFIKQYALTVAGGSENPFSEASHKGTARDQALAYLDIFKSQKKREFPTDPWEMLTTSVSAVFESWQSERANRYRARNNVRKLAGTAVNVQAMFPAERSGVLFTQDPNNPEAQRILIEAALGLGEGIVSGHVEPDLFIVDRASMKISDRQLRQKEPILNDAQIDELARLGMSIETYFKFPVDIEWSYAFGKFALLQSRRIRGLEIAEEIPRARAEESARLRKLAGTEKRAWVIHNLGETLPSPTPMTWDIIGGFMSGSGGFIKLYDELGYIPSERVRREGFLELIGGKIYADVARSGELFFDKFPLEYEINDGLATQMQGPPQKFNYERAGAGFLIKLPWYLYSMLRARRTLRLRAAEGLDVFEKKTLPQFQSYQHRCKAKDLSKLSDKELLTELAEREAVMNEFGKETLKPSLLAAEYHGRVTSTLAEVLGPEKGPACAAQLLGGLDGDKSVESNIALYRAAKGELTLDQYLAEYGHRGINELELSEKRWAEDSSFIKQRIAGAQGENSISPHHKHEQQKAQRLAAEQNLPALLAEHGASSLQEDILSDLRAAQCFLPFRETGKFYFMMAVGLVRAALEEFAQRWEVSKDLYFLQRAELAQFTTRRDELLEKIKARKIRWQAMQRLPVREVLYSEKPELLGTEEERSESQDGIYKANGIAAGTGTGPARIVKSPQDACDLGSGYILVCTSTDPGWAPLFVNAKALIVERGGVLSHGAIVARDFGIPAVVLKDASRLIPDGAIVKVDGNRGLVEVIQNERALV